MDKYALVGIFWALFFLCSFVTIIFVKAAGNYVRRDEWVLILLASVVVALLFAMFSALL